MAIILALTLSGRGFVYTYTTASETIGATAVEADIATVEPVETGQPDWDSLEPTPGGTETLRPNAPGDEHNIDKETGAGYPNHYQNVDEVNPDEGTTDVRTLSSTWLRDLYNIEDHSVGTGNIVSVTVYARASADSTPTQTSLKIALKSGGTVYEGAETTVTTSYVDYSETWTTDPSTGSLFTWPIIDSLQVGVSIREAGGDKKTLVTQVYVHVEYGEPISGEVPTGDLFVVYPDANYPGDLAVKVYLTNTANLTKAYQYLNMKLYLEGSVEAGETPNYRVLTLENGVATFNIEVPTASHTLSVTGGSYRLVSDDTSEWEAGWTLTPEFYGEVTQR